MDNTFVDSTIALWLIASLALLAGIAIGFIAGRWYPGLDSRHQVGHATKSFSFKPDCAAKGWRLPPPA